MVVASSVAELGLKPSMQRSAVGALAAVKEVFSRKPHSRDGLRSEHRRRRQMTGVLIRSRGRMVTPLVKGSASECSRCRRASYQGHLRHWRPDWDSPLVTSWLER